MLSQIIEDIPVLLVLVLLLGAFLLPVFIKGARMKTVNAVVIATEAVALLGSLYLIRLALDRGSSTYTMGGWAAPWGIEISVEPLSVLFLFTIGIVSLPVALYAIVDLPKQVGGPRRSVWFLTLYLLLTAALAGIAFSKDLFNLFVFIEVATISGCALVAGNNHAEAIEAAVKYLILATLGSGFILLGIGLLYILTGNLNMAFVGRQLAEVWTNYPHVLWIALSFFLVGFGVKAAIFPLHVWLPDAHTSAIAPASAVLSGLAVKGYILGLIKVFYFTIGPVLLDGLTVSPLLLNLGIVGVVGGSLFALSQDELKRRLAFSTVAQISYIFIGLGLANSNAMTGALFHITSHALIKSALFLAAGSIITRTGKHSIHELGGIGRRMPVTMGVFTIGSLAMVGLPLMSGFIGKWSLLTGSLEAGSTVGTVVIVLGSLLSAAYLLPIVRVAYFEPSDGNQVKEMSFTQLAPMVALVLAVIVLGTFPGPVFQLASRAAISLLGS